MSENLVDVLLFRFYSLIWTLALPLLRLNRRLAEGYEQRRLQKDIPSSVDLWIQAASGGECYLSWTLLKYLHPDHRVRVLVTTNTSQGLEILDRAIADISKDQEALDIQTAFFPFDKPGIMAAAVNVLQPRVMVLLETEIWPGLLQALKRHGTKILLLNGRMTDKSLRRYSIMRTFWRRFSPDRILAISRDDAYRFSCLSGEQRVDIMPNMKFDRLISGSDSELLDENELSSVLGNRQFVVLGSIRKEEEEAIVKIIMEIRKRKPKAVIGLFPRHLHRIDRWKERFALLSVPCILRTEMGAVVQPETIVLWDTFGELISAYKTATAVFVGGSLAPCGGQNFLEPLISGVKPIIGPSWENFAWVGQEIVDQGLVRTATGWLDVAELLIKDLDHPLNRDQVRQAGLQYLKQRQGGTEKACRLISEFLSLE